MDSQYRLFLLLWIYFQKISSLLKNPFSNSRQHIDDADSLVLGKGVVEEKPELHLFLLEKGEGTHNSIFYPPFFALLLYILLD